MITGLFAILDARLFGSGGNDIHHSFVIEPKAGNADRGQAPARVAGSDVEGGEHALIEEV